MYEELEKANITPLTNKQLEKAKITISNDLIYRKRMTVIEAIQEGIIKIEPVEDKNKSVAQVLRETGHKELFD